MVGTRIKEAREAIPMTQEEFAAAIGVTSRAVGAWEQGQSRPRPKHIRAIAAYTGRSTQHLLALDEAVA